MDSVSVLPSLLSGSDDFTLYWLLAYQFLYGMWFCMVMICTNWLSSVPEISSSALL